MLAISAMLMLSTNSQGLVLAHEEPPTDHNADDHIHYSEIIVPDAMGDDFPAVQTFKSVDPEGKGVYWDVTGLDADDFEINATTGVLRFMDPPDFEDPSDRGLNLNPGDSFPNDNDFADEGEFAPDDNRYQITVRATEKETPGDPMGRALSTEMAITVVVDNMNEKGEVMLQWREPEVGTNMQAYLEDPDGGTTNTNVDFTWWRSKVGGKPDPKFDGHWEEIEDNNAVSEETTGTTDPTTGLHAPGSTRPGYARHRTR